VSDKTTESTRAAGRQTPLEKSLPLLVLVLAALVRLVPAKSYFLNPDEALHFLAASQTSLSLTYRAALTNAHPPLLILILHYWKILGQSELMLRMPSVLAGVASCWLFYLWLSEIRDRSVALIGLVLMSFAPSLIALSAEVRQYALLLFFVAASLLLSERAIRNNSWRCMALFSFLCTAHSLLTIHHCFLL
jgi:Predicted membrane protein